MDFGKDRFFVILGARLDQLGTRQRLTAENMANAATPEFTPRNIDTRRWEDAISASVGQNEPGRLRMARSDPGHLPSVDSARGARVRVVNSPDSETTIDGNSVVIEDQMLRAAETRLAFETTIGLYQKGLAMVRLAARGPR